MSTAIKRITSNPFKSLYMPERVIADVTYPNYSIEERELDKVRLVLSPITGEQKDFVLLVVAQESISPMQYGYETFALIKAFLAYYDITFKQTEIILDYAQRTGINKDNITKWIFTLDSKGNYNNDRFGQIEQDLLKHVEIIRSRYYQDFNITLK